MKFSVPLQGQLTRKIWAGPDCWVVPALAESSSGGSPSDSGRGGGNEERNYAPNRRHVTTSDSDEWPGN